MGERMLDAFEAEPKTDMLLIFDGYEGSETFSALSRPGIESMVKSVSEVGRYVVAGAPKAAQTMVEAFGKVLPLETRAFDDPAEAWAFLGARPLA